MKPIFSSVELRDALIKKIASKIGEENVYLLEEKLSVEFRDLEEQLENFTDVINSILLDGIPQDSPNERNNPKSK